MMEKLRIILIDPSEQWVTNNPNLKYFEQVMIPIGLMYLSAFLKERFSTRIETKIVNTIVDLNELEQIEDILEEFVPDIIGIRAVIFYNDVVNTLSRICKRKFPDALLIAGGPDITPESQAICNNTNIDLFIEGEGEETLCEIIEYYFKSGKSGLINSTRFIKGIFYRVDGKIIKNESRELIQDINQLPIPDYDAINLEHYTKFLNYGYNRRKMGVLFTSRGCPYKCIYCHNIFGKVFRYRNAQSIYDEIAYLHNKYGIKDFCIVDDNFTFNYERVEEFTKKIIDSKLEIKLYFPNGLRADSLTYELVDKLIKAGMIWATFSLETASERLQRFIKKNVDITKLEYIVKYCCEKGIITNLCVMIGFPTESLKEAEDSLNYLFGFNKLIMPYYFSIKYYPGTEIYDMSEQYGITLNVNAHLHSYHGSAFQETPQISRSDFDRLYRKYMRDIFLNSEKLKSSIDILSRHFSEEEIKDIYTLLFRRKIVNIEKDIINLGLDQD